jgi:flagellar hook assembly protein FlgD
MKYKLVSVPEAAKGKVKVASNGKVTVKKGLSKGTYNVEVEIAAAATKNCNKTQLKKTFVLEVK